LLRKEINDLLSISATKGLFPIGSLPPSMGDFILKYSQFYGKFQSNLSAKGVLAAKLFDFKRNI
jgi:hypothetical protein